MSAELVPFPESEIADVPRVLRAIADRIEAGDYGEPKAAVVVLEADTVQTFGAGRADFYRGVSLLQQASHALLSRP